MTHQQFEVLVTFTQKKEKYAQRDIAKQLDVSLGVVNKAIQELQELGYIKVLGKSKYEVTAAGYKALEPYKVKRAIFMAAGFGSRMVPVTLNTPKPLIKVKGERIIDTLIDAVLAAGIEDITIVRGYLKEQFDTLLTKYPMITFIDNDFYNEANNISSAYIAKDLLENAYVLESDLVLYNPEIIRAYEYNSNYLGKKVDVTDDWCFYSKKGIITELAVGGKNCHHMYGISYWNAEDGKKLATDIETVYQSPGGKEKYWDEVALRECIDHYSVHIKPVHEGDIIEIDTFKELCDIDPAYKVVS